MSRYTYGASGPIAFSTFDTWANNVSSDTNTGLDNALSDFYPTQSAPYEASLLLNSAIFYGNVVAGTGGTVAMTAPYSQGATSSFTLKNFDTNDYSLTLVASATYPYTFHSWRTAAGGGGSQLSTSATYTPTGGALDTATFYAYFTTTHISP